MQFFYWIVLLIAIGIAVFAIQNSNASPVTIQLLLWPIKTSLVYTILGSIVLGILTTLLFWIPRAIRSSFEWQKVPTEVPRTSHNPFKKRRPL